MIPGTRPKSPNNVRGWFLSSQRTPCKPLDVKRQSQTSPYLGEACLKMVLAAGTLQSNF